jgi:hypothetical protein
MSVRAYKIAEELGIERNEFVGRRRCSASSSGNAMATLDEDQIRALREVSIKELQWRHGKCVCAVGRTWGSAGARAADIPGARPRPRLVRRACSREPETGAERRR